jgi:hypothetical protein
MLRPSSSSLRCRRKQAQCPVTVAILSNTNVDVLTILYAKGLCRTGEGYCRLRLNVDYSSGRVPVGKINAILSRTWQPWLRAVCAVSFLYSATLEEEDVH